MDNSSSSSSSLLGDDESNRFVEIEFSDVGTRRAASFTDRHNLTLGALSEDCALFANQPRDEEDDEEDAALADFGASELVRQVCVLVRKSWIELLVGWLSCSNGPGVVLVLRHFSQLDKFC
jgi:hypothetical protein